MTTTGSDIENVTHDSHKSSFDQICEALSLGVFPANDIHTTTIKTFGGDTYTGLGRTEEEANTRAGESYRRGKGT